MVRRARAVDELRYQHLDRYRADAMEPEYGVPIKVVLDFNRRALAIVREGVDPGPGPDSPSGA